MNLGKIGKLRLSDIIFHFIIKPAVFGLYGFSVLFIIILISKFYASLIGSIAEFSIDATDVSFAFWGFFFVFIINLLKKIQYYHSQNLHD